MSDLIDTKNMLKTTNLFREKSPKRFMGNSVFNKTKSTNQDSLQKTLIVIFANDQETRFLFKTAFEIWNYEVVEAENLKQLIISTKSRIPELILIDAEINISKSFVKMNYLQKHYQFKKTGFILLSGHAQEEVRRNAMIAGANIFLTKPIDFDLLKESIKNYFNKEIGNKSNTFEGDI